MTKHIGIEVNVIERNKRLDDFLFDRLSGLSKMYLREAVKNGKCEVNGRFENIGYKLCENDFVEIELDITRENAMRPQEMALEIVFEDDQIIVVDKAAGMLVHPTHRDKSGTLLNALAFYLNREHIGRNTTGRECDDGTADRTIAHVSAFVRPGLIHRLDKQTSGLIIVAKTARAHRILADHFHRKLVEKRYLALVEGIVEKDEGTIEGTIGRYAEQKRWDIKQDGKRAETRFWVRERYADTTLLELEPVTGRTNQLRIHCAHIGHAIIGDTKRGGPQNERLCLHAYKLAFRHPVGGEPLRFEIASPFDNIEKS